MSSVSLGISIRLHGGVRRLEEGAQAELGDGGVLGELEEGPTPGNGETGSRGRRGRRQAPGQPRSAA